MLRPDVLFDFRNSWKFHNFELDREKRTGSVEWKGNSLFVDTSIYKIYELVRKKFTTIFSQKLTTLPV